MFDTLVAGGAGDATSYAGEVAQAAVEAYVGAGAAAVLGNVAARGAEGIINRRLIKRFGGRVASAIRPIRRAA